MAGDKIDELLSELREHIGFTGPEWQVFARRVAAHANVMAFGAPVILGPDDVAVGMRVRVRPFVQVAVSRSSSTPVQLPVAVPAEITDMMSDAQLGPEYVTVRFPDDLYGNRPWQDDKALHIVSRGEIHSIKCRCAYCYNSGT